MRKFLFILLLIASKTIYAQDFKLAAESDNGTQYYIREEGNYNAWVKSVTKAKTIKSKKTGKLISTGGGETVGYWSCNCKTRVYDITSSVKYDKNHKPLTSLSDVYNERPLPDSVGEAVFNIICGYDDYLDDIRQKEYDVMSEKINAELDEGIKRYDNYSKGFYDGYKKIYCSPSSDCQVTIKLPDEVYYAETPEGDYEKGYNEGADSAKAQSN